MTHNKGRDNISFSGILDKLPETTQKQLEGLDSVLKRVDSQLQAEGLDGTLAKNVKDIKGNPHL